MIIIEIVVYIPLLNTFIFYEQPYKVKYHLSINLQKQAITYFNYYFIYCHIIRLNFPLQGKCLMNSPLRQQQLKIYTREIACCECNHTHYRRGIYHHIRLPLVLSYIFVCISVLLE